MKKEQNLKTNFLEKNKTYFINKYLLNEY